MHIFNGTAQRRKESQRGGWQTRPLLWVVLIVAALAAGCGGLGGEPRIIATAPPAATALEEVGYPLMPPDVALGAQLFAQNCTRCHGIGGRGDGELAASGQIPPPPDFTDPATTRDRRPTDWFEVITNGRIEQRMPPWRDALTEDERWAVAMYTYTLPYSQTQLEQGREVYQATCAECHGETGRGDGERAGEITRPVGDFTDQAEMAALPDKTLYTVVTEGQGTQMPAFGDDLSEEQRRAVVGYVRSLALANTDSLGEVISTEEATAAVLPEAMTITGQVTNGTADAPVPPDVPVTLFVVQETESGVDSTPLETTADAEGRYTFENVPMAAENRYVVRAVYQQRGFASDLVSGTELGAQDGVLPVTLYELTADPSVMRIKAMSMRIESLNDGLQILQEAVFENTSDRLYTNDLQVGDGAFASVIVGVPPGAVGFAFNSQNRYVVSEEQLVVVDTIPVVPGEDHLVQFSYFMPYEGGALIEYPVFYAVDGEAEILLAQASLNIASDQFERVEPVVLNNREYKTYRGTLALVAGDLVRFDLMGQAMNLSSAEADAPSSAPLMLVLGVVIEVALIGGLFYWVLRRRRRAPAAPNWQAQIDLLVRQIADLDNRREAGRLDDPTYQTQRAQLKAQLAELMEQD
jgi:mono/diheme cytochrome c family protein